MRERHIRARTRSTPQLPGMLTQVTLIGPDGVRQSAAAASMSRVWVHLRQRRALSSGSPHLDSASTAARSTCGVTSTRRTGEARLDQPGKPRRRESRICLIRFMGVPFL